MKLLKHTRALFFVSTILCALVCASSAFAVTTEATTHRATADAAGSASGFIRAEDDLEGTAAQNEVAPDTGEDGSGTTESNGEVYIAPDEEEYQGQTTGQSGQTSNVDSSSKAGVDEIDSFPTWIIPTSVGFVVLALICIFASILLRRKSVSTGTGAHSKK